MSLPTPKELSILAQFQDRLSDLPFNNGEDDKDTQMLLIRFLRARNHNLSKAEDMLRKHLQWRKVNKIDSLMEWTPPKFIVDDCQCQFDVAGFDKQGCPVIVIPLGIWDVRKVCEKGMKQEYVKHVDSLFQHAFQAMKESSQRVGHPVTQFNCILIADEFQPLRQMSSPQAVESVLQTVRRFEVNFPETLKFGFLFDFPSAFNILLNMTVPMLNSSTIAKTTLSSNEKEYTAILRNLIDEDQLCVRLGGTRRSKIPILNAARGEYTQRKEISDGFFEVTIGAGKMFKLQHHIDKEDSQISWAFKTANHDIGFSITGTDVKELVPYSRVASHVELYEGTVTCLKPGAYTTLFDNTFSRFRSKVLQYKVTVEEKKFGRPSVNAFSIMGGNETDNSSNGNRNSSGSESEMDSASR